MAYGIRVWDQSGATVILDTTTWCGQVIGSVTVPAGHAAGSFQDARLALGRPYVIVLPYDNNTGATSAGNPVNTSASVNGTTVNYTAGNSACQIIYGFY